LLLLCLERMALLQPPCEREVEGEGDGCERAGQPCGLVHGHQTQERSGVGGCHREGCGRRTVDLDLRRGGGVACEEDN